MKNKLIGICIPLFLLFLLPLAFATDATTASYTVVSVSNEIVGGAASSASYTFDAIGGLGAGGTGTTASYSFSIGDSASSSTTTTAEVESSSTATSTSDTTTTANPVGSSDDEEEVEEEQIKKTAEFEEPEDVADAEEQPEDVIDEVVEEGSNWTYYTFGGVILGILILVGLILFFTRKK